MDENRDEYIISYYCENCKSSNVFEMGCLNCGSRKITHERLY